MSSKTLDVKRAHFCSSLGASGEREGDCPVSQQSWEKKTTPEREDGGSFTSEEENSFGARDIMKEEGRRGTQFGLNGGLQPKKNIYVMGTKQCARH